MNAVSVQMDERQPVANADGSLRDPQVSSARVCARLRVGVCACMYVFVCVFVCVCVCVCRVCVCVRE